MQKVIVRKTGEEGEYIGVFQCSGVVGESPMIGGHRGGVVSYPVVVAKISNSFKQFRLDAVDVIKEEETLTLHADGETYTFGGQDLGEATINLKEFSHRCDMLNGVKKANEPIFICWNGNVRFEGREEDIDDIRGQIKVLEKNGVIGPLTIPPGVQMTTYNKK